MELSPLLRTCEHVWKQIQAYNSDVPEVVIVIGSGGRRSQTLLGHFAKNTWGNPEEQTDATEENQLHEVLLVAENLNRTAEEVFTTLIHEAVHGIAHVRGIRECSGQRHNKKFAILCEEVGLIPPESPSPKLGFSAATLSEELATLYAPEIKLLDEKLQITRKLKLKETTTKKTTWIATCDCQRKIRVPRKTIIDPANLEIACADCGGKFEMDLEEIDSFKETVRG